MIFAKNGSYEPVTLTPRYDNTDHPSNMLQLSNAVQIFEGKCVRQNNIWFGNFGSLSKMYNFLVILKFLNGSSLDSILDKVNLFSFLLAHYEAFICKISTHCPNIVSFILWFLIIAIGLTLIIDNLNVLRNK